MLICICNTVGLLELTYFYFTFTLITFIHAISPVFCRLLFTF